ncbi:MAG TPA: hypothetical protein VD907_06605 [Verrucomicrobiae bacterium]|nr:hypothetical protein [Verrucomicrobiae bacterium]
MALSLKVNSDTVFINNVRFKKNSIVGNKINGRWVLRGVPLDEVSPITFYGSTINEETGDFFGSEAELDAWLQANALAPDDGGDIGIPNGSITEIMLDPAVVTKLDNKVLKAGDTMTGPILFSDPNNRSKLILTKYPTGTGHNNAPTTFDLASVYLHLGGTEYNTNSYRLIGFGYRHSEDSSHAAAVMGYQETSGSGSDMGKLLFATRNVTTDTAPTVRLTIETNGEITAQAGAKFVGDGSGITGLTAAQIPAIPQTGVTGLPAALTAKANVASPTFTGTVVLPATTSIGPVTNTQLGYLAGVTSAIQTQINAKLTAAQGAAQADSTANDIAGLVADFNALLAKLRAANIIAT